MISYLQNNFAVINMWTHSVKWKCKYRHISLPLFKSFIELFIEVSPCWWHVLHSVTCAWQMQSMLVHDPMEAPAINSCLFFLPLVFLTLPSCFPFLCTQHRRQLVVDPSGGTDGGGSGRGRHILPVHWAAPPPRRAREAPGGRRGGRGRRRGWWQQSEGQIWDDHDELRRLSPSGLSAFTVSQMNTSAASICKDRIHVSVSSHW